MTFLRKYSPLLVLILFLLVSSVFFLNLYNKAKAKDLNARALKLENQHYRSLDQFSSSVDKFAGLVSGMRSYMNLSTELPSAANFQHFVENQYSDLGLQDSIVVSLIDTSHTFVQSFTRNALDPVNLVGLSVKEFRSVEKIRELDELMQHDSLQLFPPINLVEGWVGLPLNFRVHRNDSTIGYVAPVLSFKSILDEIYSNFNHEEFVIHFSTEEGFDFDREQTYNETQVYSKNRDPEYYKNFDVDSSQFLYTTKTFYGFDIKIGTAYKNAYEGNETYSTLLIFWYFTAIILATLVMWLVSRYRKLNVKLLKNNTLLRTNKKEIGEKNNQLQQLNTTQTKFFSIIGHDIKQPLSAIEGLITLLHYEEIKDPDLAEIVKNLSKATKNTTNLLNNLLRWARSQTGDIKYNPTQISLNNLLEEVVETLYFQAKEKSIRIIHIPQEELNYTGDRDMLQTVFRNLISNAIKFTNPGGTVSIDARKKISTIEISVVDSGIGMSPAAIESLFQLDTQVSTVGTTGEMGTGLGLILCQIFVKNHGGSIKIDSEIDRGTSFTVILPIN